MRLAQDISIQRVGELSLRRWCALLPLKEDTREKVIEQVKTIERTEGKVTDEKFREIVKEVEPKGEDIKNKDYIRYFNLETLGRKIIETLESVKTDLKEFNHIYKRHCSFDSFKNYPAKKRLLLIHQEIERKTELK